MFLCMSIIIINLLYLLRVRRTENTHTHAHTQTHKQNTSRDERHPIHTHTHTHTHTHPHTLNNIELFQPITTFFPLTLILLEKQTLIFPFYPNEMNQGPYEITQSRISLSFSGVVTEGIWH